MLAFPLMNLTLAPGIADKNDYDVLDDGRRIGRIFLSPHAPDGHPWFWGIFPPPVGNEGYAATREEAMADLNAATASAPRNLWTNPTATQISSEATRR